MELFQRILKLAVEGVASDVHIKIGVPVVFRISRKLVNIECPIPTKEWMNNVIEHDHPQALQATGWMTTTRRTSPTSCPAWGGFEPTSTSNAGEWCLAMRYVKTQVPSFEELGLLRNPQEVRRGPARHRAAGRRHRLRQVHHPGAPWSNTSTPTSAATSSPWRTRSNTCSRTTSASSNSARSGSTPLTSIPRLRNVLRQDPDVIMIGEMRDAISFAAAMSAADTGHLVFSTVHTTNASQAITRILDFFKADEREQVRRQLSGHPAGRHLPAHDHDRWTAGSPRPRKS